MAKKTPSPETYLVQLRDTYGSSIASQRTFTVRKDAEKFAENWVDDNSARRASLAIFSSKGKLKTQLSFGPQQITDFLWSQQSTDDHVG